MRYQPKLRLTQLLEFLVLEFYLFSQTNFFNFNYLYQIIGFSSKMEQKHKSSKSVNFITNFMQMRFSPAAIIKQERKSSFSRFFGKIKEIMGNRSCEEEGEPVVTTDEERGGEESIILDSLIKQSYSNKLRYLEKLTAQHILIGNESQLDLINISKIQNKFVETEYLWSIRLSAPINLLAVDSKRFLIALGNVTEKFVDLYKYNNRKIHNNPVEFYRITVPQNQVVRRICFFKDCLALVTENSVITYTINSNQQVSLKSQLAFPIPENKDLKFYTAPHPYETTLNIFLEEYSPKKRVFTLWLVEVQYQGKKIKIETAQKVYDIQVTFRKKMTIKNFSKETFLMNLGSEILAFKKGYIIDSAMINVKNEHSILEYIGDEKLLHLSDRRFQIYSFNLDISKKPYKIRVQSLDAIDITRPRDTEYFKILQVLNGCYMIIFQILPYRNRKTKGQIDYWFAVTQPISIQEKINQIFSVRRITELSEEALLDKCDMVQKMGLSMREIFLQLWNRSTKVSDKDFELLLKTSDYETIHGEIVKKLKKSSMPFKKFLLNEKNTLEMLKKKVYSPACTQKILYNYINSHFFIKKLQNFRQLVLFEKSFPHQKRKPSEEKEKHFMIGIQDYYQIKHQNIYDTTLSLIDDFCHEGKNVIYKIRFMLCNFKFPLRMIYLQFLEQVIKNVKGKILNLLKQVPELLPYSSEENEAPAIAPAGYYDGVWQEISSNEWKQNLYYSAIKSIDNETVLKKLIKDVNYWRNRYETHGMIDENQDQIIAHFKFIKSQWTFYSVIQWIFNEVSSKEERKKIFSFIEQKYPLMPSYLHGRILLYHDIYHYLKKHSILPEKQGKPFSFQQFLQFEDHYLFKHLFDKQKTEKGLILKKIKPLYEQVSNEGLHFFNENLMNYFKSQVSSLSDLKYIFNRINNEKEEFHTKNQQMYEVLINTMGYKLMIGTGNDIPLEQILIYVENIPINRENEVLNRLTVITDINKNIKLLREAKVNMSVEEIIMNPHTTISGVLDYLINKEKVTGQQNQSTFLLKSYGILAQAQFLYSQIYKNNEQSSLFIFFLYLVKLAVDYMAIKNIKIILQDQNLIKQFNFDESLSENVVLYMYLSKLHEDPIYVNNLFYLRTLMTLLPEQNQIRQFIICQYQFAKELSHRPLIIEYPLSQYHPSPSLFELEVFLSQLPADYILKLEVDKIFSLMNRMIQLNSRICESLQYFSLEDKSELVSTVFHNRNTRQITRRQVYEQFIVRLLSLNKLKESLPYIRIFLLEDAVNKEYDIVYLLCFLIELQNDIIEHDKYLFKKAAGYFYQKPITFLQLIESYVTTKFTRKQRSDFLSMEIEKGSSFSKGFNIENTLLSQSIMLKNAKNQGRVQEKDVLQKLQACYKFIEVQRSAYSKLNFRFIFTMLINSPYTLAKYMVCSKRLNTQKNIRIFLISLSATDAFNKSHILEFGRRIFLIILISLKYQKPIQDIVRQFQEYPFDMDYEEKEEENQEEEIPFFKRLRQNSEYFRKQKEKLKEAEKNKLVYQGEQIEYDDENDQKSEFIHKQQKKAQKEIHPENVAKKILNAKTKGKPNAQAENKSFKDKDYLLRVNSLEQSETQPFQYNININIKEPQQESSPKFQKKTTQKNVHQAEIPIIVKESALSQCPSDNESNQSIISERSYGRLHEEELQQEIEMKCQKCQAEQQHKQTWKHLYEHFEDLPSVKQLGGKLYHTNMFKLSKKKKHDYDISLLKQHQKSPSFKQYLRNILRYLYIESAEEPLCNILNMIQYIISIYPEVSMNKKHFIVFIRAQNLQIRYHLDLPIRVLFPIDVLFDISADREKLFEKLLPHILEKGEQSNIVKISKIVSHAFEMNYLETQIIFAFFVKFLAYDTKRMDEKELKQHIEKCEVLITLLSPSILSERFHEGYEKITDGNLKKSIRKSVVEKMKKKGLKQQKIKFFTLLENEDPECKAQLQKLKKRR